MSKPIRFSDFAARHGLEVDVDVDKPKALKGLLHYSAELKDVEVKDDGMLASFSGHGATPAKAIADYAKRLRGQLIVFKAYTSERREIRCPNAWLTEEPPQAASDLEKHRDFLRWCLLTVSKGFTADADGQKRACEVLKELDSEEMPNNQTG